MISLNLFWFIRIWDDTNILRAPYEFVSLRFYCKLNIINDVDHGEKQAAIVRRMGLSRRQLAEL